MREIKFRAWARICSEDYKMYYNININAWLALDWKTPLMQYTGLKDKNGTEIYEGDVLKNTEEGGEQEGNIFIISNSFMRGINIDQTYEKYVYGWEIPYKIDECEIIGNICENPELKKVEEEME